MTSIETATYNFRGAATTTGGDAGTAVYYIGISGDASLIHGVHLRWDSTLAGSVTVWTSNFSNGDAPLNSTTAGAWIQQNPSTGYTAISPSGAATAATPLVLNIPGGTAGGADLTWGNLGSKRVRLVLTVTTNGTLWVRSHGKS